MFLDLIGNMRKKNYCKLMNYFSKGYDMKLLYIHQHYEENKGATRSYELSKRFIENGAKVVMISGQGDSHVTKGGLVVKSTHTTYHQKMKKMRRILAFIHFFLWSIILGMREKNIDKIYATSTPLTVGLVGLILSKCKRKPFIFEVRDVWPDVPVKLGFIQNRGMIRLLKWLEMRIYKSAAHIVVLSEGMKQNLLQKNISASKVTIAENFANQKLVQESNEKELEDVLVKNWMKDKFVVVHPGTMGLVNGVDYLIACAEELQYNDSIHFLLIGEGSEKQKMQAQIKEKQLTNIRILDARSKQETLQVVSRCQMGTMLVKNERILWDNSANKFFDFLACGLPVVLNYQGWQKQALEECGAGKGFSHEEVDAYCTYVVSLAADQRSWEQAHQASKKLAEKYDIDRIANRIWRVIMNTRSVPVETLD
ncbi:glycosyltransferase family 4 protein [Listeria newyorkensis]|uniref:Glycosyltransferase family 4 protein n=1 Tax=Listeria newyorkensis TaxID=1497681 RepID=A0A841YX24_9LIST|nr:glycosyltransferase family 4 protein [Listeria newyorkensis]MBC1457223.1 glycosyltransferase family 4 protein [Listeria newyorkensis]